MLLFASLLSVALIPQGEGRFPAYPEQDARSYDITLAVDFTTQSLRGTVDYRFTAAAPLDSIRLDALRSDDWHVTFRDRDGVELQADWHDDHCVVPMAKKVATGDDVHFVAELSGKPVDGFYFKQNRYGEWMAFTDHYSIRARGWLPCEDHPKDRARFSIHVACPEELQVVGFGKMPVPATVGGGFQQMTLQSDEEIPPYMFALVIGPLARVPEPGDPRILDHFVYRQDLEQAKVALVHHAAWLHAMEGAFGPYPYAKYTTVQCPTRWGGFEAPGNVQLAENLFDGKDHGVGTLAHELVHMWFGDAVGYAEWHEVWLSEGFASYFGPWLHAQAGGPTLQASMRGLRDRWLGSADGRTKTVRSDRFAHPDQALNANTYPKGAWVLHMLRQELGDETFFATLKHYVTQCRARSVTTAEFVTRIEESSKQELSWFFDQWLDRVGCPELKLTRRDDGVLVEQVQQGEPYVFRLTLGFTGADGVADRRLVRVTAPRTFVSLPAGARDVTLDPDVELLFRPAR